MGRVGESKNKYFLMVNFNDFYLSFGFYFLRVYLIDLLMILVFMLFNYFFIVLVWIG